MVERMQQRLRENMARNLRRLRTERGWSQRQLSEKASVSQTYISQIETNSKRPGRGVNQDSQIDRTYTLGLIASFAVALDVSPADLIAD